MNDERLQSLMDRMASLERANRRLKNAGLAAVLSVIVALACGGAGQTEVADAVVARRFVLRDGQGRDRLVIALSEAGEGGPRIALLGTDAEERAVLGLADEDAPMLSLSDPTGRCEYRVEAAPDSVGVVLLREGKLRSLSGISPAGGVGMLLKDADDTTRYQTTVAADGTTGVQMLGPDGKKRLSLEGTAEGRMNVGLYDSRGTMRLGGGQLGEAETLRALAKDRMGKTTATWSGDALVAEHDGPHRGNDATTEETLEARRLVLKDREGRERLLLDADIEGVPTIAMRDPDGRDRMTLRLPQGAFSEFMLYRKTGEPVACIAEDELAEGEAFLAFYGPERKTRAQLGVEIDGSSYIRLLDGQESDRTVIRQESDGRSSIALSDAAGQTGAELFLGDAEDAEGNVQAVATLSLNDGQGVQRLQATTFGDGRSSLAFFDVEQHDRLTLLGQPDGSAAITFFDQDTRPRLGMATRADGYGGFAVLDADGVERVGIEVLAEGNRPVVRISDPEKRVRAALGTMDDGAGYVATFGETGRTTFQGPELILGDRERE